MRFCFDKVPLGTVLPLVVTIFFSHTGPPHESNYRQPFASGSRQD